MVHKEAALKLSQNIVKSMVYIINQSYGDFQQGGCLYKPTSGIQWTPEHTWTSDRPQKQALAKADLSTFGNDIPHIVRSDIYLFADDIKLSRTIKNSDDIQILQDDIP